jgi:hypothetical protein
MLPKASSSFVGKDADGRMDITSHYASKAGKKEAALTNERT